MRMLIPTIMAVLVAIAFDALFYDGTYTGAVWEMIQQIIIHW